MEDTLIGISASYNITENAPEKAAKEYRRYIQRGSKLISLLSLRSTIDGIDNLKFLYPIAGVPIVAYTILNAVDQGAAVRVVGSTEVKNLVGLINEELKTGIDFVHEGKRAAALGLGNSLDRLFTGYLRSRNIFVTGDIPFARGYAKIPYRGDLVIDFNTPRLLESVTHLKRNFYNRGSVDGTIQAFKEANIYYFTEKGFDVLLPLADLFYQNRKAGGLYRALIEYIKLETMRNERFRNNLRKVAFPIAKQVGIIALQNTVRLKHPADLEKCNNLVSFLYKIDWRFTFTHGDIFRMLDIDGINNDWVLYEGLVRQLEESGNLDERIVRLRRTVSANKAMFPIYEHFEEILHSFMHQVDEHLPQRHRINFRTLEEFYEKNKTEGSRELADLILSSQRQEQHGTPAYQAQARG